MLTVDQIPLRSREVLLKLQQTFPEAVIVGGYLRDLWAGLEPKDIDIFIGPVTFGETPADTLLRVLAGASGAPNWTHTGLVYDQSYMGNANWADPVNLIASTVVPGETDVQVISMAKAMTVEDHLARVDLDFNQIVFDGQQLVHTAAFLGAMTFRIVKLGRQGSGVEQEDRTARRIVRLREKFRPEDGWEFPALGHGVAA